MEVAHVGDFGGMVGDPWPPEEVPQEFFSLLQNCYPDRGRIRNDPGALAYNSGSYSGTPLWVGMYKSYAGIVTPVIMTTAGAWYAGAGGWTQMAFEGGASATWSISDDHQMSAVSFEDWLVFAHEELPLYKYNGGELVEVGGSDGYTTQGEHRATMVAELGNSLVLFSTIEDSQKVYQRVRTSATGEMEEWETGVGTAANFFDLAVSKGPIVAAQKLGADSIMVYAEDAVFHMFWTNSWPFFDFREVTRSHLSACVAQRSVAQVDGMHLYLGVDGVMVLKGSGGPTPAKGFEFIRQKYEDILSITHRHKATAVVDRSRGIYYLAVPTGAATFNIIATNVRTGMWWFSQYGSQSMNVVANGAAKRCDEFTETADQVGSGCDTFNGGGGLEYVVAENDLWDDTVDPGLGHLFYSTSAGLTGGAPEFVEKLKRWSRLTLHLAGGEVAIQASYDGGTTWTTLALQLNATATRERYHFDLSGVSRMLMFRVFGSGLVDLYAFSYTFDVLEGER